MIVKKDGWLVQTKVLFGDLLGAASDEAWATFREPSGTELAEFQAASPGSGASDGKMAAASMTVFADLMPALIVDHNFYETETMKFSAEELALFINSKPELFMRALGQYSAEVLFGLGKRIAGNSATSQPRASAASSRTRKSGRSAAGGTGAAGSRSSSPSSTTATASSSTTPTQEG